MSHAQTFLDLYLLQQSTDNGAVCGDLNGLKGRWMILSARFMVTRTST